MPIIEKLTIPPLYTHSIDYDNNLTIYEAYGAMLHTLNKTIDSLNNVTQNIIPALTKRVSKNEKDIALLLEYVDTLQQQMATLLNTTIPNINATLTNHNSRILANESDIVKIKNDIITINASLNNINSSISDIEANIRNIQNDYNDMLIIVNNNKTQIGIINTQIESIQNILTDFNNKINRNENSITSINSDLSEINQKIDNLNIDELNSLLQQIKSDIDSANAIIQQFSEINSSSFLLTTQITSIEGIRIDENIIEKNGYLCNLKLKITNMGNFFRRNTYNEIGLFPLDYFPISVDNTNYTYIGNCVISQIYNEVSEPLSNETIYHPATLWAKSDGKSILMSIIPQFPKYFNNQNNSLYINMQYFVKN